MALDMSILSKHDQLTSPLALGIDLRSGPRYPTGLAALDPSRRIREIAVVRTDEAILDAVARHGPAIIAIDAPLALPEGRCCTDPSCECASAGIMREVDRICAAAGYRPFPALLPSMVGLTLRGIELHRILEAAGHCVIEVYPGMAQDVLGIPRKRQGIDALRRGLFRQGVRGMPRRRAGRPRRVVTHDELDAVTCALVGLMHLEGSTETMGPGLPVPLVLPRRVALAG